MEADHLINLPILKAHASMVFSGALKNIKGVVQDKVHMQMHQQNLTMAMMDVWSACRADINIMDAMRAASGYSPHMPVPIETNMILGSKDPVAIDRVACEVTGIDTSCVDYFKVAKETGLGNYDLEDIEVVGNTIEESYKKMWIPYIGDMSTRWPEYDVKCEGACSSCQALLAINMEELKAVGEYEKNEGMTVVIGGKNEIPKDIPDEKIVLHGNCTKKYLKDHPNAYWILGCPPNEPALYLTVQRKKSSMVWVTRRKKLSVHVWQEMQLYGEILYSKQLTNTTRSIRTRDNGRICICRHGSETPQFAECHFYR